MTDFNVFHLKKVLPYKSKCYHTHFNLCYLNFVRALYHFKLTIILWERCTILNVLPLLPNYQMCYCIVLYIELNRYLNYFSRITTSYRQVFKKEEEIYFYIFIRKWEWRVVMRWKLASYVAISLKMLWKTFGNVLKMVQKFHKSTVTSMVTRMVTHGKPW